MTVTGKVDLASHLRQRLEKKPLLLMTHLVVGYPSLDANWAMLEAMDSAGVDLFELQLPRQASGFVYCAARKGVTGRKTDLSEGVAAFLERCRKATSVPLGLGFGIRTAADVRELRGLADIAIIGTAGLDAWQERGPEGYRLFLKSLVAETV
jgi:tryptophan synthase alpha subunit